MTERQWDKKLNIKTAGKDSSNADDNHNRYEPTPYSVLERLAQSGFITAENTVVDYGCGKGRVGFFLNHAIGCRVIGVEYDWNMQSLAKENLKSYGETDDIQFVWGTAENFEPDEADRFYFFNPFSVGILRSVLRRIADSYYQNPRTMRLFFYYTDESYLPILLAGSDDISELIYFLDEIDCRDLFRGKNEREKIMIFEIGGDI